jgi:hypothetical protein
LSHGAAFRTYSRAAADVGVSIEEPVMKKSLSTMALMLAASVAWANNCPNEMKAIDAKLATQPKLAEADAAKVKQLRADGEAAHKAGKHDDSMRMLGDAKKLLGI